MAASLVQPPTNLYLQPEDSLSLIYLQPVIAPPIAIILNLRFMRPDGEIATTRKVFNTATTSGSFTFTLGEGFLLSASAYATTGAMQEPGGLFLTLLVVRDIGDPNTYPWILFADYCTNNHFPTWPFGRVIFPQDGPGRIRSITGTVPAAGADISETVPTGVRWILLALRATLTTSATVATRIPNLTLDDGANIFSYNGLLAQTQGASTTTPWTWAGNVPSGSSGISALLALTTPNLLQQAFRIRTQTAAIQAGDQWTAPQYLVQEWISM
jgi:hypothetical protein